MCKLKGGAWLHLMDRCLMHYIENLVIHRTASQIEILAVDYPKGRKNNRIIDGFFTRMLTR